MNEHSNPDQFSLAADNEVDTVANSVPSVDSISLIDAIDTLLEAIDFDSEAESIKPENVAKTQKAFEHFLNSTGLHLSSHAFKDILIENSGENAFRDDGKTPNWYHFFRQVLPKLDAIKSGLITEETLNK